MEKLLIIKPGYNQIDKNSLSSEELFRNFFPMVEKENKMIIQYLLQKYPDIVNREQYDDAYDLSHTPAGIGVMEDKKRWGGKIIKTFYSVDTFEKHMTKVYEIVQWGYEYNLKKILEEE